MSQKTIPELVGDFCRDPHYLDNLLYVEDIDTFYYFNKEKFFFELLTDRDLERKVYSYIINNIPNKNFTTGTVKDFIAQIKYVVYRVSPSLNFDYIALNDGFALNTNDFSIVSSTNKLDVFHNVNCSSDDMKNIEEVEPPERFSQFLDEVLVDKNLQPDKGLRRTVQEMMGYYLMNNLLAHTVFFLTGRGRNGKSVLLDVIREMVGNDFCTAMSVGDLTSDIFAAAALIGKKVNICAEDESNYVKTDKFKALVGGDPINIRKMYQESFQWKPTVKYLFATNEMPSFSGFNTALIERIKIIPFNRFFKKEERDVYLFKKLKKEMGGIIAWSIQGAKRLKENGFVFTETEQMNKMSMGFQENVSATVLFFNENYEVDENSFISNEDLYERYKLWSEKRGKKKQGYYNFIKDLNTHINLPDIEGLSDDNLKAKGKAIRPKI